MTDQLMVDTWSELLRPLFPLHAEISGKPKRRTILVQWQQAGIGTESPQSRSVAITFTNLAWKGYRGARSARRTRADQQLEALVRSHLSQFDLLKEAAYGSSDEAEISIASVDLFPPMAGGSPASESPPPG
jgi:hypothetical protein